MAERDKQYGTSAFITFLIFPFLGFIRACGRLRAPLCGLTFVLFYALFGYCISFADPRQDSFRIQGEFLSKYVPTFDAAYHQYTSGLEPDLLKIILFWLVGTFTKNPHVYFCIVGFLGAIFAYLTISRILKDYSIKKAWTYIAIVVLLLLVFKPIVIGGVRFWSAMGLASYAAIKVTIDRKYLWLIAFCIVPFMHFSMIAWLPIILIATFANIPQKLLFWSAVSCCLLGTSISGTSYQEAVGNIVTSIGIENESVKGKTSFYTSDAATKEFDKSLTTHIMKVVDYANSAWFLLVVFSLKKIFSKAKRMRKFRLINKVWRIYLFFAAFGYLMTGLSVVGSRYQLFANVFATLLFTLLLSSGDCSIVRIVKKLIIYKLIILSVPFAQMIYISICGVSHEIFWAPLPYIIAFV